MHGPSRAKLTKPKIGKDMFKPHMEYLLYCENRGCGAYLIASAEDWI